MTGTNLLNTFRIDLKCLRAVKIGNNAGAKAVTLTLPGVQNSGRWLFEPHCESLKQRDGCGEFMLLDYTERFNLADASYELANLLFHIAPYYDTIYLDGVSCGARVFVQAIIELYLRKEQAVLNKIVFNSIDGVISPQDVKTSSFNLAKVLPGWLALILTPFLKWVHRKGWRKEAASYDKLDDEMIIKLNTDANQRISWRLLKQQVAAMNTPLQSFSRQISIKQCVVVTSIDDEVIDNQHNFNSLSGLLKPLRQVELPTKHSTLAYQPDVWREGFYTICCY